MTRGEFAINDDKKALFLLPVFRYQFNEILCGLAEVCIFGIGYANLPGRSEGKSIEFYTFRILFNIMIRQETAGKMSFYH